MAFMHMESSPRRSPLCFQKIPGVSAPPRIWVNSNQVLDRFIRHHRNHLEEAGGTALRLCKELTALFPLIEKVSRATCPRCEDPCCIVTKVWYDFIDLLFFHLISAPLPPRPLADRLEDPCQYLSPRGCRLSRLIRPWGCLQYTCPSQKRFLRERHPQAEQGLDLALGRIRTLRYRLEDQFQRAVTSASEHTFAPTNIPQTKI
jgi:hypothetical protein